MDSKVASATIQAALLNGLSGVFAQGIMAYQKGTLNHVDVSSILRFLVYTVLTTPPNYKWQEFLEKRFPTTTEDPEPGSESKPSRKTETTTTVGGKLNVANTAAKFILDQALGAPINTLLFLCLMGQMTSQSSAHILNSIANDFWPMLLAGYRIWPIVCLLNLVAVPFDYRQLVGSVAGLGWGVFLSLNQIKQ